MDQTELLARSHAIRISIHAAWRAATVDACCGRESDFERMANPVPGDMVAETSTIHHAPNIKACGRLVRTVEEPVDFAADDPGFVWDESVEGHPHPTETIHYLVTLAGEEVRWRNAGFAASVAEGSDPNLAQTCSAHGPA